MAGRCPRRLVFLATASLALALLPGIAFSEDGPHQTAEEVLSRADYQRDLPAAGDLTEPSRERRSEVSPDDNDARQPAPAPPRRTAPVPEYRRDSAGGGIGPVAKFVLWVLLAVGGILLLVYIVNIVSARRGRGRTPSVAPAMPASAPAPSTNRESQTPPRPPTLLEKTDALARNGEFAESIHTLLFASIDLLRRRFGAHFAPSSTSRELLAGISLPAAAKTAFSVVVAAVEVSHFGGQALNERAYLKCRESFVRLIDQEGAKG